MATRGRKPKPTAIKILEGNPGKRKLNDREPVLDKRAPDCPTWLTTEARKEWHRLASTMEAMGVLTEVDRAAFAAYCQAYARWKEAEERIKETNLIFKAPSGYPQQSPYVGIAHQSMKIMKDFMAEFGLTPASRSRIIAGAGEVDPHDDMEELLGSA